MKSFFINLIIILTTYCSFGQTATDGLYFDGIDDTIIVPNTTNINSTVTNNRTYETSFKVDDATSSIKQVIMKEGGGTRAVIIYIESGYLYVGAYNRTDYSPIWNGTFYREAILSNTWYHVALIFDNAIAANATSNPMTATSNNALKWYLDGTLMGQISGYQLGSHNSIRLGYKNETLRFPSCGTWTVTGMSEYCFNTIANDTGSDEYYFKGYIWGFRVWNDVRTITELVDYRTDIITTVGTNDLVAALDGDTFTYLNSSDTAAEATVSPVPTIIWSATAASSDWNTGSNWVGNIVPNSLKKESAQIQVSSNYPEIASHIVVGDLTVDTGASITVNASGTMEASYDLTNNGTITVLDDASLILREKKAAVSAGTFNIQKNTPTYSDNKFYSYWSSPVISTDSNIATVFPDSPIIYMFDASVSNSDWVSTGAADFNPGIGYAVRNESTGGQVRTFVGNINKGDIEVDIYNTTNLAGTDFDGTAWSINGDNLVGNPYSAAIDWELVVADPDNTEIDGTMYLWDQNSVHVGENREADYVEYNATGGVNPSVNSIIGSGQGFFIKTTSTDPNLKITFKTTHQVAGLNTKFLRSATTNNVKKEGRSWFTFNHNDITKTLLVGFLDGATDKFDRLYDAPFDVEKKTMNFYTLVEDVYKATIQGLPVLKDDTKVVKMGFVVDELGAYTIGIEEEQIDDNYSIYLKDTEKNITIDLKEKAYNFTIDSIGENNTRFKVVYTKEKSKTLVEESYVLTETDSNDFTVYIDESKELMVTYNYDVENVKEVSLFDLQGRKVVSFVGNQKKNISNLSPGVYIVNAKLEDNKSLNKKIMIAN